VKAFLAESGIEEVCLEYFADLGWQVLHGPDIAPGEPAAERSSTGTSCWRDACGRRLRS